MAMKSIGKLEAGDRVATTDPSGVAEITSVKPATWVKTTSGPAFDVQWKVVAGPNRGEKGWYIGGKEEQIDVLPAKS